jgi:hypothetical protein
MQGFGFGLPLVESSRDTNGVGSRMSEFKANGHELGAGAADVVVVMVVFHNGWFIGTVDFQFRENVPFHIPTMHWKTLPALWGVTLPTFHEPEGRSSRRELKLETSNRLVMTSAAALSPMP